VNPAEFCDPAIDAEIDRAEQAQLADPAAAVPQWAKVDREITDEAPWISLLTPGWVDVVSERLGNYQPNPILGILLDQAWVV
jgi:peptide/nickel transport system substrate-binding protein